MQKLLALPQRPQAVFVGNDAMAVGAYQAFIRPGCDSAGYGAGGL
jgi:LacI family transcriptional regulator